MDALPPGTPLTITCTVAGPPVAGAAGSSAVWFGLADGTFVNAVDVAGAPGRGLPGCVVPPAPAPALTDRRRTWGSWPGRR